MKKRIVLALCACICFLLVSCSCEHEWAEADCLNAKTCELCGKSEGTALGHTWMDATCTMSKHCLSCGVKEGDPLPHTPGEWVTYTDYTTAEYQRVNICTVCSTTADKEVIPMTTFVDGTGFIFSPMDILFRICALYPEISSAYPISTGSSINEQIHVMQAMRDEDYGVFGYLSFRDSEENYIPITVDDTPNEVDGDVYFVVLEVKSDFPYEEILFKTLCPGITADGIESHIETLLSSMTDMGPSGSVMFDECCGLAYIISHLEAGSTMFSDDMIRIAVVPTAFLSEILGY